MYVRINMQCKNSVCCMAQCMGKKRLKTVQKPKIISCEWENSFIEFLVAANCALRYKMS